MKLTACITTRNRPQELTACLKALWSSTVSPHAIVVSDDSPEIEMQQQNQQVVTQFANTCYVLGPRRGVCANRNNTIRFTTDTDLVCFVDDDICIEPDFIETALAHYQQIPELERTKTILSGITRSQDGQAIGPTKLSFRGYFCSTEIPQSVNIHAAVFPRSFFDQEQWDENIFFGYEDAELCLRALNRNYKILYCPDLKVTNLCAGTGTLVVPAIGALTNSDIYIEAARLYVGIKRYQHLQPNVFKLIAFITIYFAHMTVYLLRSRAIHAFPRIIQQAHLGQAFSSP